MDQEPQLQSPELDALRDRATSITESYFHADIAGYTPVGDLPENAIARANIMGDNDKDEADITYVLEHVAADKQWDESHDEYMSIYQSRELAMDFFITEFDAEGNEHEVFIQAMTDGRLVSGDEQTPPSESDQAALVRLLDRMEGSLDARQADQEVLRMVSRSSEAYTEFVTEISQLQPEDAQRLVMSIDATPHLTQDRLNELLGVEGAGLLSNELLPRHTLQLGPEVMVAWSDNCKLRGRDAVLAYVVSEEHNSVSPTVFYQSNSHGVWRNLPAMDRKRAWFAKPPTENGIDAPLALQRAFSETGGGTYTDPEIDTDVFDALVPDTRKPVSLTALTVEFVDKAEYEEHDTFDFEAMSESFSLGTTAQNGPMKGRVVPVRNGTERALFVTGSEGKTWIAAIERVSAPILQSGLRSEVVNTPSLLTPPSEQKVLAKDTHGFVTESEYQDTQVTHPAVAKYLAVTS